MQYRREIDGLRAVAVLPVILFHAGLSWFSGGYVGVDVFFVISGYLITTIIINDLEMQSFSIGRFYERRARRILPALFFVLLCCIPFAWFWMTPEQLKNFFQGFVAITFFASNILFWKKEGYFSEPAEENPLLHTWSLAVEEQFYIFFPLILLGIWRFGRAPIFYTILALTFISFTFSEWGWRNAPVANWYLLPTRAWELGVGAICALILYKQPLKSNQLLSVTGLSLIIYSIFFFTESTPFPSIYAIFPVMGTALIILFGSDGTLVSKILRMRIFVGIGLISFSAYLWHQPLFAFARIKNIHAPSVFLFLCLAIASMVLAYLSWAFVEKPFRNPKKVSKRAVFVTAAVASIFFLTSGIVGHSNEGFNYRINDRVKAFTKPELEIFESVKVEPLECLNKGREQDSPCQLTKGGGGVCRSYWRQSCCSSTLAA